jgi:cytidylate kinase
MIRIIAVEREFGAGGGAIAAQLAKTLGWELLDEDLTNEIARLGNVEASVVRSKDERVDPLFYRLTKVFWRGSSEASVLLPDSSIFDADRMVALVQQVMDRAAERGNCVIVGRGAPWFMRGRADAFSVFFYAPRSEKLRRVLLRAGDQAEAEQLIDTVDTERATFVKHYFGKEWPTRCLYHCMLNTVMGDEECIKTLMGMIGQMN